MAALNVMERCSGAEMWFESQPLNWKIRRRTKGLNGGYQTHPRPLMCWSLLLHSSGTREQNIGGLQWLRRPLAGSWSGLKPLSFSPQCHREITRSFLDSMGLVSTPQSKQPDSPVVLHPPSVFPAASIHLRNC